MNVHVRISFDGFHSVASPGRYSKVLGSRMMSGSYTQSHRGFSACTWRQANGVSVPHCPTATTSRSLWAAARDGSDERRRRHRGRRDGRSLDEPPSIDALRASAI